ncbi:hypothetical protein H4582DRAFT_1962125 [Lactarius indigo]|nr:hypothetical protein H4582DRAFT_1962125 [Lactarius indigo]
MTYFSSSSPRTLLNVRSSSPVSSSSTTFQRTYSLLLSTSHMAVWCRMRRCLSHVDPTPAHDGQRHAHQEGVPLPVKNVTMHGITQGPHYLPPPYHGAARHHSQPDYPMVPYTGSAAGWTSCNKASQLMCRLSLRASSRHVTSGWAEGSLLHITSEIQARAPICSASTLDLLVTSRSGLCSKWLISRKALLIAVTHGSRRHIYNSLRPSELGIEYVILLSEYRSEFSVYISLLFWTTIWTGDDVQMN